MKDFTPFIGSSGTFLAFAWGNCDAIMGALAGLATFVYVAIKTYLLVKEIKKNRK